jgi:hypothetical protein
VILQEAGLAEALGKRREIDEPTAVQRFVT